MKPGSAAPARNGIRFLLTVLAGLGGWASATPAQVNDPHFQTSGSWGQAYPDQWGLKAVGVTDPAGDTSAWSIETGESNPVIVAVIDSGLDYFHPDLDPETVWRNPGETPNGIDDDNNGYIDDLIGWNFVDGNNNPWDFSGHGTHLAGIIGAATNNGEGIAGMNRGVRIMPLKIMNFAGRGRTVRLAEAIFYAVRMGARVINLSLGAEITSSVQQAAIDFAADNEVVVVVAAGNFGRDSAAYSPAGLANVLTVTAVDVSGNRPPFANWGDKVDLAAPGVDILSLRARRTDLSLLAYVEGYEAGEGYVGPDDRYYRADGTSFAAPFVTGAASLILARNPELKAGQVKRMIVNAAREAGPPGIDRETGYGMLDVYAALQADPEYFIDARISGVAVAQADGKPVLNVLGRFGADRLDEAWIELGQGEAPGRWSRATEGRDRPVSDDVIAQLDINLLRDSKVWTLKLVVRHQNGQSREHHYLLTLE